MMKNVFILLIMSALPTLVSAQSTLPGSPNKQVSLNNLQKVDYKSHYNYIAVNNIKMWISNDGFNAINPIDFSAGFLWPGGKHASKPAIYGEGIKFGFKINDTIRYADLLRPGKIINGFPDDPGAEKYRVYKITRESDNYFTAREKESIEIDYKEWPIEDGAPYLDINNDNEPTQGIDKPLLLGDETLWYVSNVNAINQMEFFLPPLELEIQHTVFGYNYMNILGDAVFKRYIIINKSNNYLEDMFISIYADADVGYYGDDFVGCDTVLNLGYTWNSRNEDRIYGEQPPAVGYTLLQGPCIDGVPQDSALFLGNWLKGKLNLPMTAFIHYIPPNFIGTIRPIYPFQYYNLMNGNYPDGTPIENPVSGTITTYFVSGDPVTGVGWYEGEGWPGGPLPGDRRMYLSSGPFNFAPGDTQEVVYAIHMARGTSNVSSISFLREQSRALRQFYYSEAVSMYESSEQILDIPEEYQLYQNYPNPFNPGTTITYHIPIDGNVILKVYDILGNEISSLVNEFKPAGSYQVTWNAENLSAGIYFYQIDTGGYVRTKKMILMK